MTPSLRHVLALSDDDWARLERIADGFERAWQRGERPRVGDHLPPARAGSAALRLAALIELAHAALEFQLAAGEPARADEYLKAYPELAAEREAAWSLIEAEAALRREREPQVTREEYLARFPGFRAEIDAQWSAATAHGGPARLGRFALQAVLGRGAFGVVYRAWDPERQRPVALKTPHARLVESSEEAGRFLREARSVSALAHPNIVPVYEAGRVDGTFYLASALVEGTTLADRLAAGPLDFDQSAALLADVADALAHAHQAGVVHRDLKPSNILLDAEGRPHIADFGLAKCDAAEYTLTREGELLGTPAYMSPEQARGDAHQAGPRSDVYTVGVILYQLLTGTLPFEGPARRVLHQVVHGEPPAPRSRNRAVPRDLQTICQRAMAWAPARRYATAGALADDLRRYLRREPIRARPIALPERWLDRTRRHPRLAALAGAALMSLALGAWGAAWLWRRAETARRDVYERTRREVAARQRLDAGHYSYLIARAERALDAGNVGAARQLLDDCAPALRGWEWNYLRGLRPGTARTFRERDGAVFEVAFSPDGTRLAWASGGGAVRVRDLATGRTVWTLQGRTDPVHSVAFSRDRRWIAAAGGNGSCRLWDARTGRPVRAFEGHAGTVYSVAFSPDSVRLASAGGDGTVRLWDAATGQALRTLPGQGDFVASVAFSPDGRTLASGGAGDLAVRVWDVESGRAVHVLHGHPDVVYSVAFSPDGRTLASGGGDGVIILWNARTGQKVREFTGHSGAVFGIAFHPDGRRVATAGSDGCVKLWDAAAGFELLTLKGRSDVLWSVAFSPDGTRLASAGADGRVQVHDASPRASAVTAERVLKGPRNTLRRVAFHPDGHWLAAAGGGEVRAWNLDDGRLLRTFRGHAGVISGLAFSPDGRRLAAAGGVGEIRLWDAASDAAPRVIRPSPLVSLTSAAFGPGGRQIAASCGDGRVRVWDATTGNVVHALTVSPPAVAVGAVFSPDGRWIAGAGRDGALKIWDGTTGHELHALRDPTPELRRLAASADGALLATAGSGGTVRLWHAATGRLVRTLQGPADHTVFAVAFHPEGHYLASGDGGGVIRVWDTGTGLPLLVNDAHTGAIFGITYSPDGRRLASCGWDKTVRIWDIQSALKASATVAPPENRAFQNGLKSK